MQISVQLPSVTTPHPLFNYQTLEVSYKKTSFLATSSVETVSLEEYFKTHGVSETVVVMLDDLNEETGYQCKVRLTNGNGSGQWSRGMEFKIEEDEDEDDDDEVVTIDKSKGLLKVLAPRIHNEKHKNDSSESESDESENSKSESSENEASESDESEESVEETKQIQSETLSPPVPSALPLESKSVLQPSSPIQPSPSESLPASKQIESVKISEPVQSPKSSQPQEISDATIQQLLQTGDVKTLQTVPDTHLVSWMSSDGLPALHTCILQCSDPHRMKAMLKCLMEKGCNLHQEVNCVFYII